MEREIRVRFTGDARDMQRASEDARRALNTMGRDTAEFTRSASQGMQRVSESTRNAAKDMVSELGRMAAAYASLGAAAALFWKGVSHNAEMESMKLGLATIVSANETIRDAQGKQVEGAAKLTVAQGQVAQVFEKLKIDAINTTATMPQLTQAFQAALSPMMAMGASLDQTRQVTVAMVQAMGAMSIPLDQARQEINSILQGQISEDSQLAKNLGLNNEMVKSWQSQGKLVDNLLDRLKDFTVAGEAAGKTWSGATSTLADNLGNLLGTLTGESFKTLTEEINKVNSTAFGPEAQENAAIWGRIINDSLTTAMGLAGGVGTVLLRGAKLFQDALGGIQIGAAKLGGLALRSDLIHQAVADLPERGNSAQGGSPDGIFRVGKLLPNFLPENMGSDQIAGILSKAGLRGKELEKFKQRLAEIDKMVNAGVEGQTDEILNGWERDLKASLAAAKSAAQGVKITPRKAAPAPEKATKTTKGTTYGPAIVGELYGPFEQFALPAPTYEVSGGGYDAGFEEWKRKQAEEITKNQANIGSDNDPLVKGMRAYQEWKKDEGERLVQSIASAVGLASGLTLEVINGGGLSMGSILRGVGSAASMFGGPIGMVAGAGLGILGAFADNADAGKAKTEADSKKALSRSQMAVSFGIGLESGAEGDRDRALLSLAQQANTLKEEFGSLTTEQEALVRAKEAEIKASYAAAKALEGLNQSKSWFNSTIQTADLREQLGLGKKSPNDIIGALKAAGMSGNFGALTDSKSMSTILQYYDILQKTAATPGGDKQDSSDFMHSYLKSVTGLDIGKSNLSSKELVDLFQNELIPAMLHLRDLTGGVAQGSISGAGTDNALTFDAPLNRSVVNNNTFVVQSQAFMGDKGDARAFAQMMATEIKTILSQAV